MNQKTDQKATGTLGPDFNEFTRSAAAPCDIELGDLPAALYEALKTHEAKYHRDCRSGFLFGGAFTSLLRGEKPKDYDMVVCNPEIVKLAKELNEILRQPADSYSAMADRRSLARCYEDRIAPYSTSVMMNMDNMRPVDESPFLGHFFQITAYIATDKGTGVADILFCENEVDGATLLSLLTDAPVRSVGFDFDSEQYTYHRDFKAHALDWVYKPFAEKPARPAALNKAAEKGMTIIQP